MIWSDDAYRKILANPRDDIPRLLIALEIESKDQPRAALIRSSVQKATLDANAIRSERSSATEVDGLNTEIRALLQEHGARWKIQERWTGGLIVRGFLGAIRVDTTTLDSSASALTDFPILHVVVDASIPKLPASISQTFSRLASLHLSAATDNDVSSLLQNHDLSTLRKLTLRGSITEKSLHAICQARLPMLEDLEVEAPGLRNPCEEGGYYNWDGIITHAIRSKLGEELEAQYGWRKYLHAASRFSIYPYTLEVLDILPSLPDELQVRKRFWD